jgi:molybdate transport system ATP-binding protein
MTLRVDIRRTVVSGQREFVLNVAFESGERRLALFGPSGAGKTLTVRAIAGLMRPDSGHIEINGRVFFDSEKRVNLAPQARHAAYLFQEYGLFPHLTVAQNICFGLTKRWRNPRRNDLPDAARKWISAFELQSLIHSYPSEISGGQQQRVALARALAPEPDILLLDEPLAALDAGLRKKMRVELAALLSDVAIPMILITHERADVLALADQVFRIHDGRIAGPCRPDELV